MFRLATDRNLAFAKEMDSLATKVERTVRDLTLAERYEAIGPMYRLIIPTFEKLDNFKSSHKICIYTLYKESDRHRKVNFNMTRWLQTHTRTQSHITFLDDLYELPAKDD
ncbi:hypothetical protein COOONC_02986 [Cooperia oncophora]